MSSNTTDSAAKRAAKLAKKKAWWKKNKDWINKEIRTRPHNRYSALKSRAKREGRKFQLTLETYIRKLKAGCYYCGASLMKEVGGSMDRANNDITDYTARNLVGCCSQCNKVKSDQLTKEEMVVAMRAVNKFRKAKK